MKTFLLIFIFALSLWADSAFQSKCVKSYYLTSSGTTNRINIIYSHAPSTVNQLAYSSTIFNELLFSKDLFEYDSVTARCSPKTITNNQVLISSLTGILIGFTILFFSIFLTIKVGSRND